MLLIIHVIYLHFMCYNWCELGKFIKSILTNLNWKYDVDTYTISFSVMTQITKN